MRSPQHIVLGQQGEKLARLYLLDKGYILLEKNFFYKKLEVDIIAEKDNEVIFIEVKTRRKYDMGGPEIGVDREKEENLLALSEYYINHFDLDLEYRIDIISVILNANDFAIHHFENAGEYFLID